MDGDFNPNLWLPKKDKEANKSSSKLTYGAATSENIEEITQKIEIAGIDMTSSYESWLQLGFAFSSELGEAGRDYFHRISRFHQDYNYDQCNKQYDNCLDSKSSGVTINTFFHLARENGIDISTSNINPNNYCNSKPEETKADYPTLPKSIYNNLPKYLKDVCNSVDKSHEKDTILLGSLTTISGLIPNVYGIYDNKKTFANLYLFLTAKASAGKGILNYCREIAKPIHFDKKEENHYMQEKYQKELNIYNSNKKKQPDLEKPIPPPVKLVFIPANSSATGVFQLLSDNKGEGIIFETEGDTLSNTFRSDYGNYSDGFRKAFHNEPITYFRRANNEHAEIEKPKLAAILSGTPNQIQTLIPSAENGLYSRFMFYYIDIKNQWKNVFNSNSNECLDEFFQQSGTEFHIFHHRLKQTPEIRISLSHHQKKSFNEKFSILQNQYHSLLGDNFLATVRRLGLIAYRIIMVLSIIRQMDSEELETNIIADDKDFTIALDIAQTIIKHAYNLFKTLPKNAKLSGNIPTRKDSFFNKLPKSFTTQDYINSANNLNIPMKTAEGYITEFVKNGLLKRIKNGHYTKD